MRSPSSIGSILLEALLSVGLLLIIFTAFGGVFSVTRGGTARQQQEQLALWGATEGLEALQSITFSGLSLTNASSLTFGGGQWSLTGSGSESLSSGITRTVRVKQVNRDGSCNVVGSGGSVDPDSKTLESEVTWIDLAGRSHQLLLSTLRTQWEGPTGSCFAPASSCTEIDYTTNAEWYGGKQLRQVYFKNNCSSSVTVDKILFTWNNSAKVQQSFFATTKVWSSSGPGSPSGNQSSGTTLDMQNYVLGAGTSTELNKTQFTDQMTGTTITIKLIFTDGSSVSTPPFTPH